jgi:hypothetical protein
MSKRATRPFPVGAAALVLTIVAFLQMQFLNRAFAGGEVFFPGLELLQDDDLGGSLSKGTGILPKRFALVIGIDNYDKSYKGADGSDRKGRMFAPPLQHAASDATSFANAISNAGFEDITRLITTNEGDRITRNEIFHAIGELDQKVAEAYRETNRLPIVLFYFAGHGLYFNMNDQSGSDNNFIVASDFIPLSGYDVPQMAIKVDDIIGRFRLSIPALVIAVIDACRDNGVYPIDDQTTVHFGHDKGANWSAPSEIGPLPIELTFESTKRLWLIQSTLQAQGARDDGKFTAALVTAINTMRNDAKANQSGLASNFDKLNEIARDNLSSTTGSPQEMTIRNEASEFDFFRTQLDYNNELCNIKSATASYVSLLGGVSSFSKKREADRNVWCQLIKVRQKFTRYSYFESWVSDFLDNYEKDFAQDQCESTQLNPYVESPSGTVELTSQRAQTHGVGGTVSPVLLSSVSDAIYRGALGQLDLAQPINSLAQSVLPAKVFVKPSGGGETSCTIDQYDLIQLLDVSMLNSGQRINQPSDRNQLLKIRTTTGCVGYTEGDAVIPGRAAINFSIPISKTDRACDVQVATPTAFPSWMVTDGAIYYDDTNSSSHGVALAQANLLKANILEQVATVSQDLAQNLNITVQPVTGVDLQKYNVAPGTMKAFLSVIPVTNDAIKTLPARDFGNAISVDAGSINIATVMSPDLKGGPVEFTPSATLGDFLERKKDEGARQRGDREKHPAVITYGETSSQSGTAVETSLSVGERHPAEACLESANEQVKKTADTIGPFRHGRVYIQLSSSSLEMTRAYNAITPALRRAGFLVRASEVVAATKAPQGAGEVRYCAVGQNQDAARFALSILEGCAIGPFNLAPPLPARICNPAKTKGNIEVWLRQ